MAQCRALGLDALEMAWVHRVTMTPSGARRVRQAAADDDIRLSVHAPYYLNLNSPDPEIVSASRDRILAAARAAAWCGATDVVLHLGYYHDDPPEKVRRRMVVGLREARDRLYDEGVTVTLRPEVMGRASQFGDLEEVLTLCREVPGSAPCLDVAHLHARGHGRYGPGTTFAPLWGRLAAVLGATSLADVHVHLSGIAYGGRGETKHLPLEDSDLDWRGFLASMLERGVGGVVVVESPAREEDACLVARTWREMVTRGVAAAGRP